MATKAATEQRLLFLERELAEITAERDALQETANMLQSQKDLLEAQVEFLAAWREGELQRLRYEAMTHALRQGLAQHGVESTLESED